MKKIFSTTVIMVLSIAFLIGCSASKTVKNTSSALGLTNQVSKNLGLTKDQTEAGIGAMMMLSKDKLSADDFSKLTKDIPGASGLMNKAESLGVIPGSISNTADILKLLNKLGISPVTAAKFIPAVLGAAKTLSGGAFGLLSKVF